MISGIWDISSNKKKSWNKLFLKHLVIYGDVGTEYLKSGLNERTDFKFAI